MTKKESYPSDLTDEQFEFIKQFLPKSNQFGRPSLDLRQVLNALLYVVVGGSPMADVAEGVSVLEIGVSLFLEMAQK